MLMSYLKHSAANKRIVFLRGVVTGFNIEEYLWKVNLLSRLNRSDLPAAQNHDEDEEFAASFQWSS